MNDADDIVAILTENTDARRERSAFVARLRNKHGLKFKDIGRQLNVTKQRAHKLYGLHSLLKEMDGEPTVKPVECVTIFLNQSGFNGQYLIEEKGEHFLLTANQFMADAWQERWSAFEELDSVLETLGYRCRVFGEPAQRRFYFYPAS